MGDTENEGLKAKIEQLKAEFDNVAKELHCLPSRFIGANGHVAAKAKQLQAEIDNLKVVIKGMKENENAILMRVQYSLEKLGKESTLFLIEQALKG